MKGVLLWNRTLEHFTFEKTYMLYRCSNILQRAV
ncbi:hypothetical protein KL86DES1_20710 [uncultured Desulfovibrio sp.]|uniref:Uncharacterized protein n=1 Tax=uncultured Desulfovibrio sp. TaxID=167968 RepID=A0A212L4W9_9BACT|nr:hypothetical protein KL86DES1_20710 [uncultured Desulfovibrio sp.]